MKKAKKELLNKFKSAVEAIPHIANCYEGGLAALGKYKLKIELTEPRKVDGSVVIDESVRPLFPQANRWDYAISYNSEVYFIEVHSAQTSEVAVVLRKHRWLKDWLNEYAPELNAMKPKDKPAFYWIQSNNFQIQSHLPQYRQAINAGLKPIPKLRLI